MHVLLPRMSPCSFASPVHAFIHVLVVLCGCCHRYHHCCCCCYCCGPLPLWPASPVAGARGGEGQGVAAAVVVVIYITHVSLVVF